MCCSGTVPDWETWLIYMGLGFGLYKEVGTNQRVKSFHWFQIRHKFWGVFNWYLFYRFRNEEIQSRPRRNLNAARKYEGKSLSILTNMLGILPDEVTMPAADLWKVLSYLFQLNFTSHISSSYNEIILHQFPECKFNSVSTFLFCSF